jgi:hypothetical protein
MVTKVRNGGPSVSGKGIDVESLIVLTRLGSVTGHGRFIRRVGNIDVALKKANPIKKKMGINK